MIPNEYLSLWTRIQQFQLDDEKAAVTFSGKLAAAQNWDAAFTQRAVEEYRKFLLLCCISDEGAAPSQVVDEVWHLHLTYTKSYWEALCKEVLGRDLHHYPSAGGEAEDVKHREWYKATLEFYREIFDAEPPADIWPAPAQAIRLPDIPGFKLNVKAGWTIGGLLVLPFLFIWISYGTPWPFGLSGPHFLVFFAWYAAALFASYALVRMEAKRSLEGWVTDNFPANVTPFQVAAYLYGKHRALQAGIVDLIKRDLLEVSAGNRFRVKSYSYTPPAGETNPLIAAFAAEEYGSLHTYEDISGNWYDGTKFTHPALGALDKAAAARKEPFFQANVFVFAFYGMAFLRGAEGVFNGRPIGFLVAETIILSVIFFFIWRMFSLQAVIRKKVESLYAERLSGFAADYDRTVPLFALQGANAISGFAEGALLIGMFSAYSSTGWKVSSGSSGSGWDSGSSGSSCSGGGSCSSGSSCGGCSGN